MPEQMHELLVCSRGAGHTCACRSSRSGAMPSFGTKWQEREAVRSWEGFPCTRRRAVDRWLASGQEASATVMRPPAWRMALPAAPAGAAGFPAQVVPAGLCSPSPLARACPHDPLAIVRYAGGMHALLERKGKKLTRAGSLPHSF